MNCTPVNKIRVPYEIVEVKVWELTERLIGVSDETMLDILDQIDDWLHACGWTDVEFEYETMLRVDKGWFDSTLN